MFVLEKCPTCGDDVKMEGLRAIGRLYHRDCFKCVSCSGSLEEKFFTSDEQPLCEGCYKVQSIKTLASHTTGAKNIDFCLASNRKHQKERIR